MRRPLLLLAACPKLGPLVSRLGIHPLATSVRGRMGDVVFKRCHGKIIVTRVPCLSNHVPTTGQRACRARMREAMAYARSVAADPAAAALYRAAADQLRRPAFRIAVSDFLCGRIRKPETGDRKPETAETGSRKTETGNRRLGIGNRGQETGDTGIRNLRRGRRYLHFA